MTEISWTTAFGDRIHYIRSAATAMLGNAMTLNNFKFHRPAWTHHDIKNAARDLRSTADLLDKLAAKMKGAATDYPDMAEAS